jgi:NADH-quinone oxidoreductase subunit G
MFNYLKLNKTKNNNTNVEAKFVSEKIILDSIDYYYSNVIARASKTMSECRNEKIIIKRTGTKD